jgi:hypothetical protein
MLPARIHNRFTFARHLPDDLLTHLSIDVVPIAYLGNYRADQCIRARAFVDADLVENGAIWHNHQISPPPTPEHYVIRANDRLLMRYSIDAGQSLIYEFQVRNIK